MTASPEGRDPVARHPAAGISARDASWRVATARDVAVNSAHLDAEKNGRPVAATVVQEGASARGMGVAPDDSAPGMLLASIGFRVQPHKRAEVLSAVDETIRRMRQASGCARSRLLADAEDPNTFTVMSEWQSAAMANTFFSSRDFQIFKGIRILLRDEPVIVLDDVRSRVTRLIRAQ